MKLYDSLLPYNQNDQIEIREAEPYSYCQFIMGKDHTAYGRARHPWLTGSAGWNYTAVTKWILGIRANFDGLQIDPCIPATWGQFRVQRIWRGATFRIIVRNPDHVQRGVKLILLNGKEIFGSIPQQPKGSVHEVEVTMGGDRSTSDHSSRTFRRTAESNSEMLNGFSKYSTSGSDPHAPASRACPDIRMRGIWDVRGSFFRNS